MEGVQKCEPDSVWFWLIGTDCRTRARNGGCFVAVAAGPFTTTADCDYEPLHEMLLTLRTGEVAPAAVILVGPFLDETHPQVSLGNLGDTFQNVFETQVGSLPLSLLNELLRVWMICMRVRVTRIAL